MGAAYLMIIPAFFEVNVLNQLGQAHEFQKLQDLLLLVCLRLTPLIRQHCSLILLLPVV